MVRETPSNNQTRREPPLPLTLEIFQGRGESRQFPVRIRSLSARGVILTTGQAPGDLDLKDAAGRDSVIHLPAGEVAKIRGSLLWARPQDEGDPEVVLGLELSNSNLKVRRALEEQLLACPHDLKNLWDHWDAMYDDLEPSRSGQPFFRESHRLSPSEPAVARSENLVPQPQSAVPPSNHTVYWVGIGAVLAGLGFYFLAPEVYRLFGVILAAYGSLTMAGKSVWSMWQNRTWSRE